MVRQAKGGFAYHTNKLLQDHAWFVAYAPADDPRVALCVLVEHGVHGSTAAAPIARKMIEHYFAADLERIQEAKAAQDAAAGAAASGAGE